MKDLFKLSKVYSVFNTRMADSQRKVYKEVVSGSFSSFTYIDDVLLDKIIGGHFVGHCTSGRAHNNVIVLHQQSEIFDRQILFEQSVQGPCFNQKYL